MIIGGAVITVFYQPWNHLPEITGSISSRYDCNYTGNSGYLYALYLKGIHLIGPVKASMIIVEPIQYSFCSDHSGNHIYNSGFDGICLYYLFHLFPGRKKKKEEIIMKTTFLTGKSGGEIHLDYP